MLNIYKYLNTKAFTSSCLHSAVFLRDFTLVARCQFTDFPNLAVSSLHFLKLHNLSIEMRSFLGDQGYCLWFLVLLCAPIHNLISLHPYSRSTGLVAGVWTTFDLVRPFKAQGSNATTPFHRIVRPSDAPGDGKGAKFGWSVANIGDIDGNGFDDIAVGAIGETDGQNTPNIGAVYIFRMLADGTYNKTYTRLSGDDYPKLANVEEGNQFGYSLACLGSVNNNGITQLAVSAPGVYLSSVYILFINEHGEVMKNTLIRGKYEAPSSNSSFPTNSTLHNTTSLFNQSYTINGPPITYGSRFGSALANLGVLDPNYYTVLAASSLTVTGLNVVYLLYLNQTGYVKKYLTLTPDMAEIKSVYSNFGSSIVILPKIHHTDPHFTVAIGASRLYEAGSINLNAGTAFLFYITGDGRVNHTRIISETSSPGIQLPFTVSRSPYFLLIFLLYIISYPYSLLALYLSLVKGLELPLQRLGISIMISMPNMLLPLVLSYGVPTGKNYRPFPI